MVETPFVGFGSSRTQLQRNAGFHLFPYSVLTTPPQWLDSNLDKSVLQTGCFARVLDSVSVHDNKREQE
jgi:hypothetical protein